MHLDESKVDVLWLSARQQEVSFVGTMKSGCAKRSEQVDVQTQLSPGRTAHSPGHTVLAARCKRHLFATGESGWTCTMKGKFPLLPGKVLHEALVQLCKSSTEAESLRLA